MTNKIIYMDGINPSFKISFKDELELTLSNVTNIDVLNTNDRVVFVESSDEKVSSIYKVISINSDTLRLEVLLSFSPAIPLKNLTTFTPPQPIETNKFYDFPDATIDQIYSSLISSKTPLATPPVTSPLVNDRITIGENRIVYGAPGTGKSKYIDDKYPDSYRVTFHPEMTYFDFVGGIKPIIVEEQGKNKVSYEFVPGIFTKAWLEAYRKPTESITLVIEEINRANTAAVFGDLFQLLDRNSEGKSDYYINNDELVDFLRNDENVSEEEELIGENWIKLPSNLSLIGTMNSADQGVFVMDSAFKRRWRFEYRPIEFSGTKYENKKVPGLNIKWMLFAETLNNHLCNKDINEDKLIGPYFLNQTDFENIENFASKLLIYLWDDVVRHQRSEVFSRTDRFSKIIDIFKSANPFNIFSSDLKKSIIDLVDSDDQENDKSDNVVQQSVSGKDDLYLELDEDTVE